MVVIELGELAEDFLLARGEMARGFHHDLDELVAPAAAVQIRHAAALEFHHVTALRSLGYGHPLGAVQSGHLHVGTEGGLSEADRHLADKVVSLALEKRVFLHLELDAEVAAGRSGVSRLALIAELEPHPRIDTRRDIHLEVSRGTHATRTAARS